MEITDSEFSNDELIIYVIVGDKAKIFRPVDEANYPLECKILKLDWMDYDDADTVVVNMQNQI